jgi:beta-glucosidase
MGGGSYSFENIGDLVEAGKLSQDVVDTAVSRLLRAKFEMGLFEHPYLGAPSNQTSSLIHTPDNVALARELDAESIVLLENHGQTLPLSKTANIAVIGPMAHGFMNVSTIPESHAFTDPGSTETTLLMQANTAE